MCSLFDAVPQLVYGGNLAKIPVDSCRIGTYNSRGKRSLELDKPTGESSITNGGDG